MFKKELWQWFWAHGANLEANRYVFIFFLHISASVLFGVAM